MSDAKRRKIRSKTDDTKDTAAFSTAPPLSVSELAGKADSGAVVKVVRKCKRRRIGDIVLVG